MEKHNINAFTGGWFVGDFAPTLIPTSDFEACVKWFPKGQVEAAHFQRIATEISVVVSGSCRIGSETLSTGEIVVIGPGEIADFEALTDCVVVAIKTPSIPADKVLA